MRIYGVKWGIFMLIFFFLNQKWGTKRKNCWTFLFDIFCRNVIILISNNPVIWRNWKSKYKKKLFYWRPSCSIIINANQTCHNLNVLTVHQACTNRNCSLLQCVDLLKMQPVVDGFKTFWSWVLEYWTTYLHSITGCRTI